MSFFSIHHWSEVTIRSKARPNVFISSVRASPDRIDWSFLAARPRSTRVLPISSWCVRNQSVGISIPYCAKGNISWASLRNSGQKASDFAISIVTPDPVGIVDMSVSRARDVRSPVESAVSASSILWWGKKENGKNTKFPRSKCALASWIYVRAWLISWEVRRSARLLYPSSIENRAYRSSGTVTIAIVKRREAIWSLWVCIYIREARHVRRAISEAGSRLA